MKGIKALQVSRKCSVRLNESGMLSIQFMIESQDGIKKGGGGSGVGGEYCFIEFTVKKKNLFFCCFIIVISFLRKNCYSY